MDLREIQRRLDERFGALDRRSGPGFLTLVLQEEVGELAEAVRLGDREAAAKEAVDAMFAALSVANALGADAEDLLVRKFLDRPAGDVSASWDDVPTERRGRATESPQGRGGASGAGREHGRPGRGTSEGDSRGGRP